MKLPVKIISERNCRSFLKKEIKQKYGWSVNAEFEDSITLSLSKEEIIQLAYTVQTANTIMLDLGNIIFNSKQELLEFATKINFDLVNQQMFKTYKVVCDRQGNHDFRSVDIEKLIFDEIGDKLTSEPDINNPGSVLKIIIRDDKAYFGLDLTEEELSKRNYKVFNNNKSLRASVAASFLYFSDYQANKIMVDPFSLGGTIVIEAAFLASKKPVRYYTKDVVERMRLPEINPRKILDEEDKKELSEIPKKIHSLDASFSNLSSQKKNGKIAGVAKYIDFARVDAVSADLRFERNSLDLICTKIFEPSKKISDEEAFETYELFIYRFEYVLKQEGKICVIARNPDLFTKKADEFGFFEEKRKRIFQGKLELTMVMYTR